MEPALVGRTIEQATVATLVQRARGGRPQPLLISGEAGCGKTTLLQHVVAHSRRCGFRTLTLDADAIDGEIPFAALRLALTEWTRSAQDVVDTEVSRHLDQLRACLDTEPALADRAVTVMASMLALLEALAFRSPVLLAVDDLHCADVATVAVVLHLLRSMRRHRVLLAATSRPVPELRDTVSDQLAHLAKEGRLDVVEVGPFSDAELESLAELHLGRPPGPGVLTLLRERTGGLPFYAAELLSALTDSGTSGALGESAIIEPSVVPRRLATAVLARVWRAGSDAARVAPVVALLGEVGADRTAIAATLTSLSAERVSAALASLVASGLLIDDGARLRFRHAIVRDAVYDDVGPAERRRWHGAIARHLAALNRTRDARTTLEIAGHLRRAGGARDEFSHATFAAAGGIVEPSDPPAAVAWYRLALASLAPTDPSVVESQLRLSRSLVLASCFDEAGGVARAALRAARPGPERGRARTIAATATLASGDVDAAAELLRGAGTGAGGGGVRCVELDLLYAHARGDFERAACLSDQLGERIVPDGPLDAATARLTLALGAAFSGDPSVAVQRLGLHAADASVSVGPLRPWVSAVLALARLRQGRFTDAANLARAAQRQTGSGDVSAALVTYVLVLARAELGDLLAAEDAVRWFGTAPFQPMAGVARCAVGRLLSLQGDHRGAIAVLDEVEQAAHATGQLGTVALALGHRIDADIEAGDRAGAGAARARLDALPIVGTTVSLTMSRLLAAARAGDTAAAEAAVGHAVVHGLQVEAALARAALGMARTDAELLVDAYDALDRLGAVSRQRAVAIALRRLGRRVPTRRQAMSRFSHVEHDVAALVAQGLTNREVATQMSLSPKTIEAHLTRLYRRTGCRTRVELAIAVKAGRLQEIETYEDGSEAPS